MGWYSEIILPPFLDWALAQTPLPKERQKLLADVGGVVLEVGFGSGLSLPYYPTGPNAAGSSGVSRLLVLDPSPGMLARAQQRIARVPFPVQVLPYAGTGPYPVPDASCDWVTSMLTLCTLPDPSAALAEIRRVLKPGGRYRFLEHGAAEEPRLLRWQRRLTPVQRVLGGGCELDRPIDALVSAAGFGSVSVTRHRPPKWPALMGRMYIGTATR